MNQKEVTQEMYFYLSRYAESILEDSRYAAKVNGATDIQIDKAIDKILTMIKQRSY